MLFIIVILISIVQSIFGVGILLFGTPLLLILGYSFEFTLSILLPISLFVNFLQIVSNNNFKLVDYRTLKNFMFYSMPFVVIFLIIVLNFPSNVALYVGVFLVVISLEKKIQFISENLNRLVSSQKKYFILMGILHGLTNLGGSLLAVYFNKKYSDKHYVRTNIAILYMLFAFFQIITIYFYKESNYIYEVENIFYILIGIIVYFISNKYIFNKLDSGKYSNLINYFLFIMGVVIFIKSLN